MISKTLKGLTPLPLFWLPPNPTSLTLLLPQMRVDKSNSNHLFCSQLCHLIRGQWKRLIAVEPGISGQGSTKGWRSCFRDHSFTWLLAISCKLSLSPSSRGHRCGLSFLTAWRLSSQGRHGKKESQAKAVLLFMSLPGSYSGALLSYLSYFTSQGSHKALSRFGEKRHRLYLLREDGDSKALEGHMGWDVLWWPWLEYKIWNGPFSTLGMFSLSLWPLLSLCLESSSLRYACGLLPQ